MKSFQRLSAVLALLLSLVVGCGDSETDVELSLRILLQRPDAEVQPEPEPVPEPTEDEAGEFEELVQCDEVEALRPLEGTRPAGTVDLDSDLINLLSGYGESHDETFAGLWLDGDSNGGILVAFTDEIGPHREQIMDELGGEVWEAPFSVVEAQHSRIDLESTLRAVLRLRNAAVDSGRVDLQKNRVVLSLIDPSEQELESVVVAVDPDLVCSTITVLPELPEAPLEVLPQGGGVSLLSCDDYPFPASALDEPVPVAASEHPAVGALSGFIDGDPNWIVLSEAGDHALFASYDGELHVSALATPSGSGWEIAGWTFGCDLKVGLPLGLGAVEVFLDPDSPPGSDDLKIDLLVSEVACAGGRSMGKRLLEPQVIETDTEVILAVAAAAQSVEFLDCPDSPVTEVRIELERPLGNRTLVDGMFIPPRPLDEPWFLN